MQFVRLNGQLAIVMYQECSIKQLLRKLVQGIISDSWELVYWLLYWEFLQRDADRLDSIWPRLGYESLKWNSSIHDIYTFCCLDQTDCFLCQLFNYDLVLAIIPYLYLTAVLLYHGIGSTHFSIDIKDGRAFESLAGDEIDIVEESSGSTYNISFLTVSISTGFISKTLQTNTK